MNRLDGARSQPLDTLWTSYGVISVYSNADCNSHEGKKSAVLPAIRYLTIRYQIR